MAGQSLEELKAKLKIVQVAAEANETAYNSKIRAFTQVKEKVQGLKRIKTEAIQRRADEERKLLKERYSSKVRTEEMKHESVISRIKSELEVEMKALCRQKQQEIQKATTTIDNDCHDEIHQAQEAANEARKKSEENRLEARFLKDVITIKLGLQNPLVDNSIEEQAKKEDKAEPEKTAPRTTSKPCDFRNRCPWLLTTGECRFNHRSSDKVFVDEFREKWLHEEKTLNWPKVFGRLRLNMLPTMITGEHDESTQEKWRDFYNNEWDRKQVPRNHHQDRSHDRSQTRDRSRWHRQGEYAQEFSRKRAREGGNPRAYKDKDNRCTDSERRSGESTTNSVLKEIDK